jgi:2-dehydropantoate 2-reductase
MNLPPNVLLVGLGAIGTTYADRLQQALPDSFHVLVDESRKARYENAGVWLNGDSLRLSHITPDEDLEPADLILVAVKQHHLASAMALMRPFVGEQTAILSLLNGITSEEILAEAFPEATILHGFCVGTDAVRESTRTTFSKLGRIVFGEKDQPVPSETVLAVCRLFELADIPCEVPEDILHAQWWKFMMNVGVNQVSAITGATYGAFCTNPHIRSLMTMACLEVAALAPLEGVSLSEDAIGEYFGIFATLDADGKTSMLQDVLAGRPTEVDLFSGTVSALGKKHGIPTPVNDMLHHLIRFREKQTRPD